MDCVNHTGVNAEAYCQNCGKALKGRSLCPSCLVKHRVRERTRRGCKERAAPRGAG